MRDPVDTAEWKAFAETSGLQFDRDALTNPREYVDGMGLTGSCEGYTVTVSCIWVAESAGGGSKTRAPRVRYAVDLAGLIPDGLRVLMSEWYWINFKFLLPRWHRIEIGEPPRARKLAVYLPDRSALDAYLSPDRCRVLFEPLHTLVAAHSRRVQDGWLEVLFNGVSPHAGTLSAVADLARVLDSTRPLPPAGAAPQ